MKKIRFGSFPLISLPSRERQCLDSYLIKSFADKIAISSTLGTVAKTERVYITPNLIRKYFKNELQENENITVDSILLEEAKNTNPPASGNQGSNQANSNTKKPDYTNKPPREQERIKRAFQALKNLNANIIKDPFYQHNINFPIYIENSDANGVPVSYDFLLLTNDLLNKSSINEINYSDNITLIIMFMKVILSPMLRLSDLGNPSFKADSDEFRAGVVKFIEFSQQKGTNPISLMFMLLISVAKAKKMHTGPGQFGGLLASTQNMIRNVFGTKLGETTKFFDDKYPHTKSISFLLNGVDFDGIQKFFDDTAGTPSHIAGTAHEGQYTSNKEVETGVFADPVFRQFMMQKTEQYNSVLSLINAMYDFNADNDLYRDVESSDTLILKFNDGTSETSFNISQDEIIQIMDNEAMPCFMTNLRTDINNELNKAYLVFGNALRTKMNSSAQLNSKQNNGSWNASIQDIEAEIGTLQAKLQGTTDPQMATAVNDQIGLLYKQLQTKFIFNAFNDQSDPKKQIKKINLEFNLRSIQSELTYLYSDVIMKIVNEDTLSGLISKDPKIREDILSSLQNNFDQIATSILEGIKQQLKQGLMTTVQEIEQNLNTLKIEFQSSDLIKYLNDIETIIDKYQFSTANEKIKLNFTTCILNRVTDYFGSQSRIQLNIVKQAMAEKNPILKKLTNPADTKKFKSFIVTEKLMLDLYHLVYFYDTQRYIGGLINTPPSTKIFNEGNQIKYMLKRIGLENNIVYILGTNGVTLQMPDFLSLTGTPLFEKITMAELRARCLVNWEQQMWTDPKFSEQMNKTGGDPKKIQADIERVQKQLKETLTKLGNTTDENRQKPLKDLISKLEKEIEGHNQKLQNAAGSKQNFGIENLTIPHKRPEMENGPKFDDEFSNSNSGQRLPNPTGNSIPNPNSNYNLELNSAKLGSGHGFQQPLNSDLPNIMSGINSMIGQPRPNNYNNTINQNPTGYGKPPYRQN